MKCMIKPWIGHSGNIYYRVFLKRFFGWRPCGSSTQFTSREAAIEWIGAGMKDDLAVTYHSPSKGSGGRNEA